MTSFTNGTHAKLIICTLKKREITTLSHRGGSTKHLARASFIAFGSNSVSTPQLLHRGASFLPSAPVPQNSPDETVLASNEPVESLFRIKHSSWQSDIYGSKPSQRIRDKHGLKCDVRTTAEL